MALPQRGLRTMHLFAGAGGGILADLILGHIPVCAVEYASYPRRVLLARQRDGSLPQFPIWDDVRTFDGKRWAGSVDVVSGGFPCQAFSSAAHGHNTAADLWPSMFRIVSECRPRHVFAENVKEGPIERAQRDLEALGYSTARAEVSAAALGAPHIRERWWLRGDTNRHGEPVGPVDEEVAGVQEPLRDVWPNPEGTGVRVPDGLARGMEQLEAIGNGQIPAVAAFAWRALGGQMRVAGHLKRRARIFTP